MKTPCVIYARVSTNLQDTESQIRDLEKWARYNDFEIKQIFKEIKTGYDKGEKRPEYENMKEFIRTYGIKEVITYELSRLGRSAQQTLTEIKYFTKEGVNIYFKKDNLSTISNNGVNQLIITILSGIAEMEGITLKERTKNGRMNSASHGKRVGFTRIPLGFAIDDRGYITINQEEAELVRSMYKSIASGNSAGQIAKVFNFKGVPTYKDKNNVNKVLKNGTIVNPRWNPKTIKNIVKNTRYKGVRKYGGESFEVPRIVTDELWEEANLKINEHIGYMSRTKYNYLFKSKITCGQCGYTLKALRKYSREGNDKKHADVLYYTCQSYLHTGLNCDCGRFRSEVFDEFLYKIIFEKNKGVQTAIDKERSKSKQSDFKQKINYWESEIEAYKEEQERTTKSFIKGRIPEEKYDLEYSRLVKKIEEAKTEISSIKKILSGLNNPRDWNIIEKYYLSADFITKREFVEQNIQRIKVFKVDKIEFDLSKVTIPEIDWNSGRDPIKFSTMKSSKKNEVIWYVELWAFDDINPMKILMTSATGTNLYLKELEYNINARSVSINFGQDS